MKNPLAFAFLQEGAIRKPRALRPGDRVGIFSPSYPAASLFPQRLERSARSLATILQVETVISPQTWLNSGFTAGSAYQRARALLDFIEDDSIKAIFCATGGFNSSELLPFLDTQAVRSQPKIILGYSDCCALLCGLQAIAGWCTFHGPTLLPQFGEYPEPLQYTIEYLRKTIMEPSPRLEILDPDGWTDERLDWAGTEWMTRARRLATTSTREIWREGTGTGQLFGGNIETINFLIGTPYLALPKEIVLFWEATEEEAALPRIQRALAQFAHSGILDRTRAMLIGRSPHCAPFGGVSLRDVVMQQVSEFNFPVLANLAFGHTDPMFTLPVGIPATVVATPKQGTVSIEEAGVL